jgi:CRISPR type III-A-associated protein Csm2
MEIKNCIREFENNKYYKYKNQVIDYIKLANIKNKIELFFKSKNTEKMEEIFLNFKVKKNSDDKRNIYQIKNETKVLFSRIFIKEFKENLENKALNYDQNEYLNFISDIKFYAFSLQSLGEKNGVTSSQIRNVFNEIKKAYQNSKNLKLNDSSEETLKKLDEELITLEKLQIKYVYIMGKNPQNKELQNFMELLESLTKKIRSNDKNKTKENIIKFYEFVEGILAYLKYFGDSDK